MSERDKYLHYHGFEDLAFDTQRWDLLSSQEQAGVIHNFAKAYLALRELYLNLLQRLEVVEEAFQTARDIWEKPE